MRFVLALLTVAVFAFAEVISVQSTSSAQSAPKPTVAVYLEVNGQSGGQTLTDMLTERLINDGKFTVIDRAHMQTVLKEQANAAAGQVTPATEAQLGKMLGVNYLLVARVDKMSASNEQRVNPLAFFVAATPLAVTTVSISDRISIIQVSSGEVIQLISDSQLATSSTSNSGQAFVDDQLPKLLAASASAIESKIDLSKMTEARSQGPTAGRVLQIDAGSVILSLGSGDGVSVGQMVGIYDVRTVQNPDTGKTIETYIKRGELQIIQVEKDYSVAKPMSGASPIKLQIVRTE